MYPHSAWLGQDNNSPESFILLDFEIRVILKRVKLRNGHNGTGRGGTKDFIIESSLDEQTWIRILDATFTTNPTPANTCPRAPLETFEFSEQRVAQFAKFTIKSYYGNWGGGLQYINFDFIQPEPQKCQKDQLCPGN